MASTPQSPAYWPTRSSGQVGSWCSDLNSSLATVILGVIAPLSAGDPYLAIALASVMALVSGAILVVAGMARLGFVTDLLSKPIRYGYMNGIALTVLISQAPKLVGFKINSAGPLRMQSSARSYAER